MEGSVRAVYICNFKNYLLHLVPERIYAVIIYMVKMAQPRPNATQPRFNPKIKNHLRSLEAFFVNWPFHEKFLEWLNKVIQDGAWSGCCHFGKIKGSYFLFISLSKSMGAKWLNQLIMPPRTLVGIYPDQQGASVASYDGVKDLINSILLGRYKN